MTTCNLKQELVGPFNQTLFLGCSVVEFNTNLGWGADSSTLTVTLVEDPSQHPSSNIYQQQFLQDLRNIQQNNNSYIENYERATADTRVPSEFMKVQSETRDAVSYQPNDSQKNVHINVIRNIIKQEDERLAVNKDATLLETEKDFGKVCYNTVTNEKKYWLDIDPGFLGTTGAFSYNQMNPALRNQGTVIHSGLDLIGVPVNFRYGNKFSFGGIITSWKKNIGQDGVRYSVEIKNFSNLLSNSQLIIGHYGGSIFNTIPSSNNNPLGIQIGIPGPTGGNHLASGSFAQIKHGNTPNIFNIFGYLEEKGFGTATENENGIPAYKIYDAISGLLTSNTGIPSLLGPNQFSPYGGIVAKSIGYKEDKGDRSYIIPDTSASGPLRLQSRVSTTDSGSNILSLASLNDMGIIPTVKANDGINRTIFKLDISEVPRPPSWLRIKGPVISIMQFITEICDGSGFDFFIDYENNPNIGTITNRRCSGIIKIKTVSRRTQPKKNQILDFINQFVRENNPTITYNYGQEFNDSITRTMYIGGKQKRLFQYKCLRFHWKQHSMIYDPFAKNGAGSFINVPVNTILNFFRKPSQFSYRSKHQISGGHIAIDKENLPITVGSDIKNFNTQTFNQNRFGNSSLDPHFRLIRDGNYDKKPDQFTEQFDAASSIPIYLDVICPYFGKHFDGSVRRVFYDKQTGQVQILFKIQDLFIAGNTLPFDKELTDFNVKYFVVLENEIRAAGSGFEQWLTYCFDNGFYTDIERLTYRALYRKYGANSQIEIGSIHKDMIDSIKNGNLKDVSAGGQFSYANMVAFSDEIYSTLAAIHKVFANIANEYYGKSYMISMPAINSYRDFKRTNIIIGYALNDDGTEDTSIPIYAIEGTNNLYTDISVSTEGAWEEPGNIIDDAIVVGSTNSYNLTDDRGMIQPILGFNTSSFLDSKFVSYWNRYFNGTLPLGNPSYYNIASLFIGEYNILKAVHYPITTEIEQSEYVSVNRPAPGAKDVHDSPIYDSQKTYIKCSANENFEVLIQPRTNTKPEITYIKAIINLPSTVSMNVRNANSYNLKSVMLQDSLLRMLEYFGRGLIGIPADAKGSLIQGLLRSIGDNQDADARKYFKAETVLGGLLPKINFRKDFAGVVGETAKLRSIASALNLMYIRSLSDESVDPIFPISSPSTASAYDNAQIMPKAAFPSFAALPVTYNQYVYGPWINYPSLIGSGIFSEYTDLRKASSRIENLIGGIKVEVDETLVPWEYGSMSVLDKNISDRLNEDVNYQQEIENGSIELPVFPDYRLGYVVGSGGPLLSHIGVQISPNGVTTSLNFRTYTRKLGLFNKENSERLKQLNLESLKRNKEINNKYNDLQKRIKEGNVGSSTSAADFGTDSIPKVLRWSPVEILVGTASITQTKNSQLKKYSDIGYNPSWHLGPPTIAGRFNAASGICVKQLSKVTLQDFRESPRELKVGYENKSLMSLDGLMSPVSLYPTAHGATFHITKYETSKCPMCKGTKQYTYNYLGDISSADPKGGVNVVTGAKNTVVLVCDFCEIKDPIDRTATAFSNDPDPPFILTNDSDIATIRRTVNASGLVPYPKINYTTLNPLVMPVGEFINDNRQSGDLSAFAIDSVAYGVIPPSRNREGLRGIISDDINNLYSDIDNKYSQKINYQVSNNHRFFALRGPIIAHSWGYDTEGYPIPNAADEPIINNDGTVARASNGQIIRKGDKVINGVIRESEFTKSGAFYRGWAQLPSTWPVGPIDLRWDRDAKVWTVGGNNYKPVFVVLEEDLTDIQPVRGTLLNTTANNSPLPNGLRKLVFVKDNKGLTAPRGAKVFCRYSAKNGFYEPIYVGNLTTTGIITGGSMANIYKAYSIPPGVSSSDQRNTDFYNASFKNPLNYTSSVNSVGIFTFINGSWVLQSINSNC
jgi:hypothetical protein